MRFKIDKRILAGRFAYKQQLYEKLKAIICKIFSEMGADSVVKGSGRLKRKEEDEWKIKKELKENEKVEY